MEVLIIAGLIVLFLWAWIDEQSKKMRRQRIDDHKENLLKGGLMPRESKEIHREALSELGVEHPNKKLPRPQYYD